MICDIENSTKICDMGNSTNKWEEKEFELYGLHTHYYKFPSGVIIYLCSTNYKDGIRMNLFDIREKGCSLEHRIKEEATFIKGYTGSEDSDLYCHIVQQEDSNDIGIIIDTCKYTPMIKTIIDSVVKSAIAFENEKRKKNINYEVINNNQHFLDEMNKVLDIAISNSEK